VVGWPLSALAELAHKKNMMRHVAINDAPATALEKTALDKTVLDKTALEK
jgi:hypothetical protein